MKHAHPPLKCEQRLGVPIHCHLASLTWNNKTSHLFSKGQRTKRVFLLKNSWIRIFQICLNKGIYGIDFWRSQKQKNTMEIHFQLVITFLVGPAYAIVCAWEGRKSTQSPWMPSLQIIHTEVENGLWGIILLWWERGSTSRSNLSDLNQNRNTHSWEEVAYCFHSSFFFF